MAGQSRPERDDGPRSASEAGFTLVEMLVTIMVLGLVLTAVLSLLDSGGKTAYNDQERNTSLDEQTIAIHRMVLELRQAYAINGPALPSAGASISSNYLDADIVIGGTPYRVIYDCSNTVLATGKQQCVRYQSAAPSGAVSYTGNPPSGATSTVIIPRLDNGTGGVTGAGGDPVFTNVSDPSGAGGGTRPTYAQVTVKTPGAGERLQGYTHDVTLNDAIYMRNLDTGQ